MESETVDVFGFVVHKASVAITQLFQYGTKAAIDHM